MVRFNSKLIKWLTSSLELQGEKKIYIYSRFVGQKNKTGLQPVSRPVELVQYTEGWGVGVKSTLFKVFSCQDFADGQIYRTGIGARCINVAANFNLGEKLPNAF